MVPTQFQLTTRRGVLFGALLFGLPAQAEPCPPPKVLLVCPAGTVKSAIARERLRQRAAERAVTMEVQSRGLKIEDHVSPELAKRLQQDGIDLAAQPAQHLMEQDIARADLIIVFDEAAQAPGLEGARVWNVPSWNATYDQAKVALEAQIESLLDELARRRCPS